MSEKAGNFFWYELMTSDTAAAADFYKAVVGWTTRDSGVPGVDYTVYEVNGTGVAGMMKLPECDSGESARPAWVGYIKSDDTDATVAAIQEKGGQVFVPPTDIPTIGRFAMVADPHGAVFNVMAPAPMDTPMNWPAPNTPGMVGWRELHAGNGDEAWEFYSSLFGWTKQFAMEMGEMGVYQTFNHEDQWIGGMMTKMPDTPAPFWNYYFNVDDINAAITRVTNNGGQVLMGPHEVPGGSWIVQGMDPQGAMFALMQPPAM